MTATVYGPGDFWLRRDGTTAKLGEIVNGPNRHQRRAAPKLARKGALKARAFLIEKKWPVKFGRAVAWCVVRNNARHIGLMLTLDIPVREVTHGW